MKVENFYIIDTVDKFSRVIMFMFSGILLGAVLAFAYHNIFASGFGQTIIMIAFYCAIFLTYAFFANSRRQIQKVEIYKDKLAVICEKKNTISTRKEIYYSDIEKYDVSAGTDKKNQMKETPDKNRFSLRIFGQKTKITLKNNETIEFASNYKDGVLIYSPAYIYALIDLRRYLPDFPLVLDNFDSKKDPENFMLQFKYYEENEKVPCVCKNRAYLLGILKYTFVLAVISIFIAFLIAYIMYADLKNAAGAFNFVLAVLGIFLAVTVPVYLTAVLSVVLGNILNKQAREKIKSVIKD